MASRLLALPVELKVEILRYYLSLDDPIQASACRPNHTQELLLSIALVKKELHDLASEIYYGENTFVIQTNELEQWLHPQGSWRASKSPKLYMLHLGISYPNLTIGQQLRNVEIRLKVDLYLADLECGGAWTSRLDWKYLLVEEEDQEAGIPMYTWQRCIQNLKHLRLVLDFIATGYDMEDMMMMAMGTADVSRLPLMESLSYASPSRFCRSGGGSNYGLRRNHLFRRTGDTGAALRGSHRH
jgi:hypothetical protein